MNNIFYVYEHWRLDTNQCFYVGKGKEKRAYDFSHRKAYHKHTLEYLKKNNIDIEVKIIYDNLFEYEALSKEVELIKFWTDKGVKLTNSTLGGDGVSGHKHSEKTREIIKNKRKNQIMKVMSDETKEKIKISQLGKKRGKNPEHSKRMTGRKQTDEHRNNIRLGLLGSKRTDEQKENISKSLIGRVYSDEAKKNMSLSHIGKKHTEEQKLKISIANKGKKRSEESKNKMKKAQKNVKKSQESIDKMIALRRSPEFKLKVAESRAKRLGLPWPPL